MYANAILDLLAQIARGKLARIIVMEKETVIRMELALAHLNTLEKLARRNFALKIAMEMESVITEHAHVTQDLQE